MTSALATAPTKRPYQLGADDAIVKTFNGGAGHNRLLVKKPTGTGKTVWFAALKEVLEPWLKQFPDREQKMLVIAHREELLDQAADKFTKQNRKLLVTIEQGDRHASRHSDVVIASIQTLAARNFRRLKQLLLTMKFRIVIVDEAHHSAASTYRTALGLLGFLPMMRNAVDDQIEAATFDDVTEMEKALQGWDAIAPKDRLLIGVTATPNRSDAIGLGCVFQTIAYSYDLKAAIDDGYLVPIVPQVIETSTSLDGVKMQAGDFNQKQLALAVNTEKRNQAALAGWREYADGVPTIGFSVDVAHAHALADLFRADNIRAQAISGDTPKDDRRSYLRQYQDGQIDVIFNCMVLTEGTDLPITGCILHAKPTSSATLYEQMTGRGLRLYPGKTECIVIDVVDVAKRHSLQVAGVLYGLPPSLLAKGKNLKQLKNEYDAFIEKYPGVNPETMGRMTLEELQMRASTFDIWTVPALGQFGTGRVLHWIKVAEEEYRVQYPWSDGTETLSVVQDVLGHYDVSLTIRPHTGIEGTRQKTLATQIDTADHAASLAEQFVLNERRSVMKLKDVDAPWRSRPASPKQIGLLRRLGVPIEKGLLMGRASDLIDMAQARKGK
jgi:superfamily II DNA or RNA helicase